jgi:hypothetical protein
MLNESSIMQRLERLDRRCITTCSMTSSTWSGSELLL